MANVAAPSVNRVLRFVGRAWLRAFGWTTVGALPEAPRAVFVAAPHTSNWDLPFTLALAWALAVPIRWIGKDSIFKPPFGWFFRALGGVPIIRDQRLSQVQAIAEAIRKEDRAYVVIAPSGTRSKRDHWKSGFYFIAKEAQVPLILGFLDYGRKRGGLGPVLTPSGDLKADMDGIRAFYADIKGKKPDQASTPRLREEDGAAG